MKKSNSPSRDSKRKNSNRGTAKPAAKRSAVSKKRAELVGAGFSHVPFLEAVCAAIIITDKTGTITYSNPFAEELYGWRGGRM